MGRGLAPGGGTGVRTSSPLTERLLRGLPGPRVGWVVSWALVPWANLAVLAGLRDDGEIAAGDVLNRVAVTVAVLLSLWGARRVADGLDDLGPALARAVEEDRPDVEGLFRRVGSVAGPAALTVAVGVALPLDELVRGEPVEALVQLLTWSLIGVPLATAAWVYLNLQVGLLRIGRGHVTLRPYHGDRTLGLLPVGNLAFTAFWMLVGSVAPLVLTGVGDVPVVVVGLGVLVGAVALFFLSLRDLHRRMVAVKRVERQRALDLYEEAYRRTGDGLSLEVLAREGGVLGAAEALEKRAERILEWPFDEGTFARVVTIVSSSAAAILARVLLAPTGL